MDQFYFKYLIVLFFLAPWSVSADHTFRVDPSKKFDRAVLVESDDGSEMQGNIIRSPTLNVDEATKVKTKQRKKTSWVDSQMPKKVRIPSGKSEISAAGLNPQRPFKFVKPSDRGLAFERPKVNYRKRILGSTGR